MSYEAEYPDDEEGESRGKYCHMIFFSMLDHVLKFFKEDGVEIRDVHIVTPGHMNGTDRWAMELLDEIWEGEEPTEDEQVAYIYITSSGKRYVDSGMRTNEDKLINKKIYSSFNT